MVVKGNASKSYNSDKRSEKGLKRHAVSVKNETVDLA